MFGDVPQPEQNEDVSQRRPLTAQDVRERMLEIIATLREAGAMPFTPEELRSHEAMFPIMAQWLPAADGEQLLCDFMTELRRLS